MTFKIIADRLSIDGRAVPFVPTPNQGGRIEPTLIVLHDTAGRLEKGSSVKWLSQKRAGVSAHFVVERDGSVTQLVDCDMKAAHAGESTWRGRRYCNGYSIGIEIVSPGSLTVRGDRAFAWFGQSWPLTDCVKGKSDLHGESYWLPYTPEQIASVEKMIRALAIAYPRITDVVGHFEVSPRRKVDVGPHYPLARARAILANRNAPEPDLVAAAQKRLTELGYWPGAIDGHAGIDTRAAVWTFQEQNSVAMTGELDRLTVDRLLSADAKPKPVAHREATTKTELRQAGSTTMGSAFFVKRGAEVEAGLTIIDAVDKAEQFRATADRSGSLIDWVMTPAGFRFGLTILVLGAIWFGAHRIEWARLTDHVLGRHRGGAKI